MSKGLGEICVYAAVDVSGSMEGAKCQEMCHTLKTLIQDSPDDVLFDFTLFSNTSWKGATGLKVGIDLNNLQKMIKASCAKNGATALYDTWGELLISIPEKVISQDIVQIYILTDGEDNVSKRFTKDSVWELTQKIMKKGDVSLNFIQIGENSNAQILSSIKQLNSKGNQKISSLVVDDSAKGIRNALDSMKKDILLSSSKRNQQRLMESKKTCGNKNIQDGKASTLISPTIEDKAGPSSINQLSQVMPSAPDFSMLSTKRVASTTRNKDKSTSSGINPDNQDPYQAHHKKLENEMHELNIKEEDDPWTSTFVLK